MDRFDRSQLSPLRVSDTPAALPFSLDWHVVAPQLAGLDNTRAAECLIFEQYRIQGLRNRDRSRILTVTYPTNNGDIASIDIFVKRTQRDSREAERHAQLTTAGVPLPRLLWHVQASDGEDLLGFEFLDTIGIDFTSDQEINELLTLLATLNATPPSALEDSPKPPGGQPEAEFTASVRAALNTARSAGQLDWASLSIDQWLSLYEDANNWGARMPTAVTHGEMSFQQVGRARSGPLVLFDLATIGLRPRFADLANVTRGLAARGSDEAQLVDQYLNALRKRCATPVSTATDAIDEVRRVRVLGAFQSLPWLTRSVDDPELGVAALTNNINALRDDLAALSIVDPPLPRRQAVERSGI